MRILKKEDWFHADGFPIVVERREPQKPFGLHAHEFSEVVIITGGKGLHTTDEDSYELTCGDVFVIGGDRAHDYLNMEDLRLLNILFDPTELPMAMKDLPSMPGYHSLFTLEPAWRKRHQFSSRLRLPPNELVECIRTVEQIEHELQERSGGFGVMATALFMQLVAYLSRCYSRSYNPLNKSLLRIVEAISHIESHYVEPITLDELTEISGMSRRNFLRTFETTMGCPPITYLIRLRVRRACELLRHHELSITEIAMTVGFNDSNYFSRQFRGVTGTSPREYRRRY